MLHVMPYSLVEFTDFWRNILPPSSGSKGKPSKQEALCLLKCLLGYMVSPEDVAVYRVALATVESQKCFC
jgi:hypothetical protein